MKAVVILLLSCLSLWAQSPLTTGSGIDWTKPPSTTPPTMIIEVQSSALVTNTTGTSPPSNLDSIKAWGDDSGNNNHLQKLGGSRPTYAASATGNPIALPNGQPYIVFGSNPLTVNMALTNSTAGNHTQTNTFVWVMAELNATAGGTPPAGNTQNGFLYNESNGQNSQINKAQVGTWDYHMYSGTDVNVGQGLATNGWHVVIFQHAGSNSGIYIDGTNYVTGINIGTGGCNGFTMGNKFDLSNNNWAGCVAYFAWYSGRAFTDPEKHAKSVILGSTYGITIN